MLPTLTDTAYFKLHLIDSPAESGEDDFFDPTEAQLSEFVHEIVHTRTAGATISAGVGATRASWIRFSPAETPAP